ncbi:CpaF family protein [Patulibacter minatonensis]|uniref:CpaF family protein n=1 Tax=Patulibacter minatonensis TaxID=298163 RepID=UPI000A07545E|nr:ATPase, T2SS/T4P/T4SS family [Patulibacter minatonensis]
MSVHREIAADLHGRLVALAAAPAEGGVSPSPEELLERVLRRDAPLLPPEDRDEVRRLLLERTVGLGPLESLFDDDEIDEIMISGTRPVWVERRGRIEETSVAFVDEHELLHAIERMLAGAGRRVDRADPLCDARLPDGSRVHVALPPLAVDGPAVTIRRFRARRWTPDELVRHGTWSPAVAALVAEAVAERRSILVSGGTGAGKTTTLGAVASLLDPAERIVTVEDTAELRLGQPHVVRLEARPPRTDGRGGITIRELVRNALRMRPDRIVVGEVRGAEALDMVLAMTTGHDGSLSTIHARSPDAALRRLETLCLMADVGLPHVAVARMVGDAVGLVLQQTRAADGHRSVTAAAQVRSVQDGWELRPVDLDGPTDPDAGGARATSGAGARPVPGHPGDAERGA